MIRPAVIGSAAGAAFIAGLMTTVAGVGGGVAMIALLAFFLPAQTVVVLVAPVLFVGNISRFVLFRKYIDGAALRSFLITAIPAALLGGWFLLPHLPSEILQVAVGGFMLLYVLQQVLWSNKTGGWRVSAPAFLGVGAAAGVLSSTVGASAMLIAPFLEARRLDRRSFVGTMAGSTTGLNAAKMTGYMAAGLLTTTHLPEVAAAMVGILLGTYAGRTILNHVSEQAFRTLLLTVVGLSGLRLLLG